MTTTIDDVVRSFASIDLDELDRCAQLLTRKDRKYIVDADGLLAVLGALPAGVRALETDHGRWSRYESTYFDTPACDSFRMAATKRRGRFKVRTRCYVDPDTSVIEVKTKNRRGRTVKRRMPLDEAVPDVTEAVHRFATAFEPLEDYAADLVPRLTTSYRRATLVLPEPAARITIDADYRAAEIDGAVIGLRDEFVVETKTDGAPCVMDRLLWRAGCRPVTFSKYSTALAALHPDLPHNRWHRVLVEHFDRTRPGRAPAALPRPQPAAAA